MYMEKIKKRNEAIQDDLSIQREREKCLNANDYKIHKGHVNIYASLFPADDADTTRNHKLLYTCIYIVYCVIYTSVYMDRCSRWDSCCWFSTPVTRFANKPLNPWHCWA